MTEITYETLKAGIRGALTQDWNNIGDGIQAILKYLESLPLYVEVEVKKEWTEPISGLAKNCHTGMHGYHTFIPYAYGSDYNLTCDVCGYAAAWQAGQVALCDCCAQEWSGWNDRRGYLHKARRIQDVWKAEYEQFKAWMIKDWLTKVKPLEPTKHFVMERRFVPLTTVITDLIPHSP